MVNRDQRGCSMVGGGGEPFRQRPTYRGQMGHRGLGAEESRAMC